ncbi:DNA-processing protein DprA [Cytophagaceae bacterium ABcell3]|nr:DNA-processing protein DprA [Cytophagaceae bacterium ABcell3]
MNNSKFFEVAIGLIPGIGSSLTRQLVSYCGSVEQVFKYPKGKLLRIPGIGEKHAMAIIEKKVFPEAEKILKKAEQQNVKLLFYTDKEYPVRLRQINDAPVLIYYKGNADLNNSKSIGIVGTRRATDYGKELTQKIVNDLMPHQPLIVSGLAYGVDICAHKAAVACGLPTIGVMATGVDRIYPPVHKSTALKMQDRGGVLSEYVFGTEPDAHRFPSRNRIIAGMCDAVIVVEAAVSGGALITAEIANDYNREVLAVPGKIGEEYSSGCNNLIKKHKASIYTGVKDIEYLLNWDLDQSAPKVNNCAWDRALYTDDENCILELLAGVEFLHVDEISWKSQISLSRLASVLLGLECRNVIKQLPGKKYKFTS